MKIRDILLPSLLDSNNDEWKKTYTTSNKKLDKNICSIINLSTQRTVKNNIKNLFSFYISKVSLMLGQSCRVVVAFMQMNLFLLGFWCESWFINHGILLEKSFSLATKNVNSWIYQIPSIRGKASLCDDYLLLNHIHRITEWIFRSTA